MMKSWFSYDKRTAKFTTNKTTYQEACNRSERKVEDVTIIAVTKEVSVDRTKEVIETGIIHLGENRPEGLKNKLDAISDNVKWHYIGTLQTRKVKTSY